jgi:hypothetical protein
LCPQSVSGSHFPDDPQLDSTSRRTRLAKERARWQIDSVFFVEVEGTMSSFQNLRGIIETKGLSAPSTLIAARTTETEQFTCSARIKCRDTVAPVHIIASAGHCAFPGRMTYRAGEGGSRGVSLDLPGHRKIGGQNSRMRRNPITGRVNPLVTRVPTPPWIIQCLLTS